MPFLAERHRMKIENRKSGMIEKATSVWHWNLYGLPDLPEIMSGTAKRKKKEGAIPDKDNVRHLSEPQSSVGERYMTVFIPVD